MKERLVILEGDATDRVQALETGSVQCVVTSPPYWGLRDYQTARWEGGDTYCDHQQFLGGNGAASAKQVTSAGTQKYNYRDECKKCGAKRIDAQIGLEKTPEEYVAKLVALFREVRRVLKDDGTLWLNLGDSYAGSGKGGNPEKGKQATNRGSQSIGVLYETGKTAREAAVTNVTRLTFPEAGIKAKDLVGIPWMVAFALRADGWYLRSDIIWHKPNPMPESVTDRPTKAHEYLFLLTKSARYYYDADAIATPLMQSSISRLSQDVESQIGSDRVPFKTNGNMKAVAKNPSKIANTGERLDGGIAKTGNAQTSAGLHRNGGNAQRLDATTRNARTVWTIATQPYADAHFATYPPDLIKPCILAGSRIGDTILDPFAGSGTTGMVSLELGRKAILIELNPAYITLIKQRTDVTPGLPLEAA